MSIILRIVQQLTEFDLRLLNVLIILYLHTCYIYLPHRSVDFLSMQFTQLLHFDQILWILSKKSEVIINAGSLCCLSI